MRLTGKEKKSKFIRKTRRKIAGFSGRNFYFKLKRYQKSDTKLSHIMGQKIHLKNLNNLLKL